MFSFIFFLLCLYGHSAVAIAIVVVAGVGRVKVSVFPCMLFIRISNRLNAFKNYLYVSFVNNVFATFSLRFRVMIS